MKVCKELKEILKTAPFFNVSGGCGIDKSGGKSHCMDRSGIWFRFCPFCGKKIESWYDGTRWQWKEIINLKERKK